MTVNNTSQKPNSSNWAAPFFTIWTGQAISLLGSQMVQFALIWWLTKTTESATVLTTATLVGMLPTVVLGPFVGALVDRWNRKKIMLFADSGIAVVTLALAYIFFMGWTKVWMVYLALFLRALGSGFHTPAMTASTSLMVPSKQLTRVQGLNSSLQNGLNIISAPLGALLLEALDVGGVLSIDVISALFAVIPLLFIAIPQPVNSRLSQKANLAASVWEDFTEGLNYIRRWPGLVSILVMALFINMIVGPAFSLLPLLVREHFSGGALQLGWFNSAFGIGAVVGGLILGIWGGFKKKIHTSLLGLMGLAVGLSIVGFAGENMMVPAIGGILIVGIMISLTNGPINAILQSTVDPSMQGRVFTLVGSLASAMAPLGLILAGPISDLISIQIWFILGALLNFGFGIGGFFSKTLMSLEDTHADSKEKQLVNSSTGEN
jgi:DHA3 family macrolide efflux protein-like MFS transporter